MTNWHSCVKHDIPLNRYTAFSWPVNAVALGVCTISNPMAFLSFFIKLAASFMKHKYMGAPLRYVLEVEFLLTQHLKWSFAIEGIC